MRIFLKSFLYELLNSCHRLLFCTLNIISIVCMIIQYAKFRGRKDASNVSFRIFYFPNGTYLCLITKLGGLFCHLWDSYYLGEEREGGVSGQNIFSYRNSWEDVIGLHNRKWSSILLKSCKEWINMFSCKLNKLKRSCEDGMLI